MQGPFPFPTWDPQPVWITTNWLSLDLSIVGRKRGKKSHCEAFIPQGLMKLWKELDWQRGKLHHILQSQNTETHSPANQPWTVSDSRSLSQVFSSDHTWHRLHIISRILIKAPDEKTSVKDTALSINTMHQKNYFQLILNWLWLSYWPLSNFKFCRHLTSQSDCHSWCSSHHIIPTLLLVKINWPKRITMTFSPIAPIPISLVKK